MKSFKKRIRAFWTPLIVHMVCGIIGITICITGVVFKYSKEIAMLRTLSDILIALGVSIVASVIINIILTLKCENDLNWKAFEQAYYQSITKKDRIRYFQRIELRFSVFEKDDNIFMKLIIRHSFDYTNKTKVKKKYHIINLFNDNHIPEPFNVTDDFKCFLTVGDARIKLKKPVRKDGKIMIEPEYTKDTSFVLHPNESEHINYDIESIYSTNDRLIWSFQEISEGAVISFCLENISTINTLKGKYFLTILHPEADEIKNKNIGNGFLDKNGELHFDNNHMSNERSCFEPFEIRICDVILPYQGFEVKWEFF